MDEKTYDSFEAALNAFNKWKGAQAKANSAYSYMTAFTSGDGYRDAEKTEGPATAAKYMSDAKNNYFYWKSARNEAKDAFDKELENAPDLTSAAARELGWAELADYLKKLEDKHVRSASEKKEGFPSPNQKVEFRVESYKFSGKTYDYGDVKGKYLDAAGEDGFRYSMFVSERVAVEAEEKGVFQVSGTVKEIKDYYGKSVVSLRSPKLAICPAGIDSATEFDQEINDLALEGKLVSVQNKSDVPDSAKPYMYYERSNTRGYAVNVETRMVYRDWEKDLYYHVVLFSDYTLD